MNKKIFPKYFINILKRVVDNAGFLSHSFFQKKQGTT
jgi:hypothetical protein